MFQSLMSDGSAWGVAMLVYGQNVSIEGLRLQMHPSLAVNAPIIVRSTYGTLLQLGMVPTIIYLPLYLAGHDGIAAALIGWIVFQIIGGLLIFPLQIRGWLLGFHTVVALPISLLGYWLTITTFEFNFL